MRFPVIVLLGVVLVGCAGTPSGQVTYTASPPIADPPAYRVRSKAKAVVPPPHDWRIEEDRFITTHPRKMSVEAFGFSMEQIDARLKELDKPN